MTQTIAKVTAANAADHGQTDEARNAGALLKFVESQLPPIRTEALTAFDTPDPASDDA